jgi:metallo-beta-lactamase class B
MKSSLFFFVLFLPFMVNAISPDQNIRIDNDITLIKISEGFYVHLTTAEIPKFGRFPSNGLTVIKNGKALIIDTPVTNDATQSMVEYLKDSMGVQTKLFIGGHFHIDCIGGMEYLKKAGIKTILNSRTKIKCIENNLPLPDTTFDENYLFNFEGIPVECRYVGGGHTADNIIVYFPDQKILFGGCLVKTVNSPNLGNLQDAVVGEWKATIQRIIELYPTVNIVVPGHGDYGGIELLYHTIELVDNYQKQ